jgi:glycosyltransferase involved in cell wall biosynthesis
MSVAHTELLFSTIMVCRNAAVTIDAAIDSVAAQTWTGVELVVIDGGSTDGTVQKLAAWAAKLDGRMSWISEPDQGVYDAMNKGIVRARGRYLHFLNADDQYADDGVLERVAGAAGSAIVIYGDVRFVDARDGFSELVAGGHRIIDFALSRSPHHQGSFLRADVVRSAGGFRTDLGTACDLALMAKLRVGHGQGFVRVPGVIADFSLGGLSARPDSLLRRERDRARAVAASFGYFAGGLNFLLGITLWIRSWMREGLDRAGLLTAWRRVKERLRPGRYRVGGGQ